MKRKNIKARFETAALRTLQRHSCYDLSGEKYHHALQCNLWKKKCVWASVNPHAHQRRLSYQCLDRNHRRSTNRNVSSAWTPWRGQMRDVSTRSAVRLAGEYSNLSLPTYLVPARWRSRLFRAISATLSGLHFSKPIDQKWSSWSLATTIIHSIVSWFPVVGTTKESDVWDSSWSRREPNGKTFSWKDL